MALSRTKMAGKSAEEATTDAKMSMLKFLSAGKSFFISEAEL
jgi:hypothetical protein